MYGIRADAIVGYTYRAENLCTSCTYEHLLTDWDPWRGPEYELDRLARHLGIDRLDESSYDSGDFPKVIFASDVENHERCDDCGEGL